ncbi:MAG: N-acetyltransferase [Rhodanobacter sp.]|nr:MAG: N-acetyltransferase [Rhodanobacter sp.]
MDGIAPPTFEFETARLFLRPLQAGDEALYHSLYTDPETMRFIAPPLSGEQASSRFQKIVARQREPSLGSRFLAMIEKATRQPIGICGTTHHDAQAQRLEVGMVLLREGRNRGVAKEALAALMKRIFASSSIDEIEVKFSVENRAAEQLFISLGFSPCADAVGEPGLLSECRWSVHRSSWYVNQTVN